MPPGPNDGHILILLICYFAWQKKVKAEDGIEFLLEIEFDMELGRVPRIV